MPPPPKRKWPNRPRGGGGAGANGAAPGAPTTPRNNAQLPKRPKIEEAAPKADGVDVKQMYSTSAGNAEAKPFSQLSGVLDKSLLDGLDKMGFE
jgi:ATP-dependent RNA helicase MSS116